MTHILRELDWFDHHGWRAHLAELRALPQSVDRDAQIESAKAHLASIAAFPETPPKFAPGGPSRGFWVRGHLTNRGHRF